MNDRQPDGLDTMTLDARVKLAIALAEGDITHSEWLGRSEAIERAMDIL